MSVRDRNHNGFAQRWESTAELARQFGFPVRAVQRQVQDGELIPTWRTPSGKARWTRADFAAQTAPARIEARLPDPEVHPDGVTSWRGRARVKAQPQRGITVQAYGSWMLIDTETARELAAVLPAAIALAEGRDPDCACRELHRDGHIEMIVPVPTCPAHLGATP